MAGSILYIDIFVVPPELVTAAFQILLRENFTLVTFVRTF
jgi:hypothetical protein